MLSKSMLNRGKQIGHRGTWMAIFLLAVLTPCLSSAQPLGTAEIRVLGMQVNIDTRPDIDGLQTTMTAVRNFPTAVRSFVGFPGTDALPRLPAGWTVKAELTGPGSGGEVVTLSCVPNHLMEIPTPKVSGDYFLYNVRLEDDEGNLILERDPTSEPVIISVIDKLLITQVTSRPLTLEEIEEKGIVIDEDNFTAMNFNVGLTVGSEQVVIDLPMLIPKASQGLAMSPPPSASFHFEPARFSNINIPNLSLVGFTLAVPDDQKEGEFEIPPVSGVIIIPGNIAFLNQFFSVILQATNIAPDGSGLTLRNAQAAIQLPPGNDDIRGTGDDPLRVAETQTGGVKDELPLLDPSGSDAVMPQGTNQAEFLVEGLREGTHLVNFDITGDLFIPSLGDTVRMTGRAAGTVQVKNPTFSMTLAHPDVVREGEAYSIFATVTNTSSSPANLFRLSLSTRSLSGARLEEGESGLRTLDTLLPGQAESFEYRLVARTTGKVGGTVFLADEGVNGSFVLTTGVGDTGIPLSPDTLILPRTVDYLPDEPDIVFASVRLLGQAYSVATAPAGSLPPDISRISKSYVFDRAVKLAQAGLHAGFGEDRLATAGDILLDYLGNDLGRLDTLYPDPGERSAVEEDMHAFDSLRRMADAGHNLSDVLGQLVRNFGLSGNRSPAEVQLNWAELSASKPAHLSFGVNAGGVPVYLRMTDGEGNVLGRLNNDEEIARDIPFAGRLGLSETGSAELLLAASPVSESHTLEFAFPEETSGAEISLIVPDGGAMVRVTYPLISLPAGSHGKMTCDRTGSNTFVFEIDTDGDSVSDQTLTPAAVTPVEDSPPSLTGVLQWAKGNLPTTQTGFATGDPLGRMAGVLFSEEVTGETAENTDNYHMPAHHIKDIRLQPDRRMVFLMMSEPAGSLVSRELTVTGVKDMRSLAMEEETLELAGDPERGSAGVVSGMVQGPTGTPVPFARIRYLQPVRCPACEGTGWTRDCVISEITADASGRYQLDFVLMNEHTADNKDIWLNENHASGTDNFKLEATDPMTGETGKASTRIHHEGQHMILNIIIRGFGGIKGTVCDEEGDIVMGGDPGTSVPMLHVHAKNMSTGESYQSWADSSGHYAFPRNFQAPDGTEHTVPRVAVGNLVLQVIRQSDAYTGVVTVNIPAAEMTVTQDIVLISPTLYGTVSGRVLEGDGETGASGVLVQISGRMLTGAGLHSREYGTGLVGSAHTDGSGFFLFENVPTGDVEVRAFRQATYEQADAKSYLDEEHGEKFLTLILPGSGGTVRGYVRDALGREVAGAKVAGGPTLTETDEDGDFEITGLPVGRFTIYAQGPDSSALGTEEVEILSGSDILEGVLITLAPVGSVRGTVYEADEATVIPSQKVQMWVGNTGVTAETHTDENGEYQFEGYPVNSYSLRAVSGDYGDGGMALTEIRYAGDVRDADIFFRGLGEIKGRVIQSNGTPVISDVIITRKVWRVIPGGGRNEDNYYLDYVDALKEKMRQG